MYARAYGLDQLKYVNDPMSDLVMQENTQASPLVTSQLDLPDSMQRYQEEMINMRMPEKRPREDEQGGEAEVRERSRKMMNIMQYGDIRGDMDLAYKPELEQVPQPYRTQNENKYSTFQKDKAASARYGWRGEAQKDDMMRAPLADPKFRHADSRKYAPGFIRTMPKTTMDEKVVPLHSKFKVAKLPQNYRYVENNWLLQYCKDSTKTGDTKKKNKVNSGQAVRHNVDELEDKTNTNIIYSMVKGDYDRNKRLKPDVKGVDEDVIAERKEQRITPTKKYVQFNKILNVSDLVHVVEKINNIEIALKKKYNQHPKLSFATTEGSEIVEDTLEISEDARLPNKAKTFVIHPGLENELTDDSKVSNTKLKEQKHYKQNRNTGVQPSYTNDKYNEYGREDKNIKKGNIRMLMDKMNPINETEFMTSEKYHKTQKNISFGTVDNKVDHTKNSEFGRKAKTGHAEHLGNYRIDEFKVYDDKVVNTETKKHVNRGKQNRAIHPDTILVTTDPYANITPKKKKVNLYDHNKSISTNEHLLKINE